MHRIQYALLQYFVTCVFSTLSCSIEKSARVVLCI